MSIAKLPIDSDGDIDIFDDIPDENPNEQKAKAGSPIGELMEELGARPDTVKTKKSKAKKAAKKKVQQDRAPIVASKEEAGISILDDIKIPYRSERRSYPFDQLEVGQCFMVECEDIKHQRSLRSSATRWNRNDEGRRFVVRRMPDLESTLGVWRVS